MKSVNIFRLGVWSLFPILGIFSYLYFSGSKLIAYGFLFIPYLAIVARGLVGKPLSVPHLTLTRKSLTQYMLFLLVILIFGFASIRSIGYEFHSFIHFLMQFLFVFVMSVFFWLYFDSVAKSPKENLSQTIWSDLAISILLIISFNLLVYFLLGFESPAVDKYTFRLESRISFLEFRVEFPFAHTTREFAQISGLAFILCSAFLFNKLRQFKLDIGSMLALLGIFIAALAIMLADARMILFVSVICTMMLTIFVARRRIGILVWSYLALTLAFPLFYFLILLYLNNTVNIEVFGSPTLTLTGRLYVWAAAIQDILELDILQWLVGSGYQSQAVTGMSDEYALLFSNWKDTTNISFHNATLQTLFDTGLIGLAVYYSFILFLVRSNVRSVVGSSNHRNTKYAAVLGLVLLLYFIGVGITEAITPLYNDSFVILLVILSIQEFVFQNTGNRHHVEHGYP